MKKYKNVDDVRGQVIEVNEEFMPYGTKTMDSKDRITLGGRLKSAIGKKMTVEGFMVYVGKNGDILLRPSVSVASSEAWIYKDPEVMGSIRKGLKEAGEGRITRVKNLGSFLDKL